MNDYDHAGQAPISEQPIQAPKPASTVQRLVVLEETVVGFKAVLARVSAFLNSSQREREAREAKDRQFSATLQDLQARINAQEERHHQDVKALDGRLDRFDNELKALIRKLNSSPKILALLEDNESGLSRVRAGDGSSKEAVQRDYSLLISKLHRAYSKQDNNWYIQTDASIVASSLLCVLLDRIDAKDARFVLLEPLRSISVLDRQKAHGAIDDDLANHLARTFETVASQMARLDYVFQTSAPAPFPRIIAVAQCEEIDSIHDGSIKSSLSLARNN